LKKAIAIYKNNKSLFSFIGLSYFDKAVIFILPLAVLSLFKDKSVYVSIEYIYSIVVVVVPFLDLGLGGYFFYAYRNNDNHRKVVSEILKTFHLIYIGVLLVGLGLILIHYFVYPFEEYIVYVVSRSIFILAFTFLTSYYRLINKPHKALFITISSNIISLVFLLFFFVSESDFSLWLVFIGQILFCIIYFFKVLKRIVFKWVKSYESFHIVEMLKKSILFSWPTIIQVFILMYVGNYGKINALEMLSIDDGVLLSLTQRFSMLIQLTHGAIIGYLMKEIFVSGELLNINRKVFLKYFGLLLVSVIMVVLIITGFMYFNGTSYETGFLIQIIGLLVGYTFFWCIFSYFEIYYSRENKNIIKMYLAIFNGIVFILIFNILDNAYLERITLSMFVSTLLTLIVSLIILKKRNYKLI
jgi:O-antigen/teichoic acid export membrane protein